MWSVGRRAKKLIVAFHFQYANEAAWKCDVCRKSGLEKKRRCAWLGISVESDPTPVWVRKGAVAQACPVSLITPLSLSFLEQYTAWKLFGGSDLKTTPGKTVDAFCVLETEYRKEMSDER